MLSIGIETKLKEYNNSDIDCAIRNLIYDSIINSSIIIKFL